MFNTSLGTPWDRKSSLLKHGFELQVSKKIQKGKPLIDILTSYPGGQRITKYHSSPAINVQDQRCHMVSFQAMGTCLWVCCNFKGKSSRYHYANIRYYGTDRNASTIYWHWQSCNKLVITVMRGLRVMILALTLRLDANIWCIALALMQ